MSMEKKSGVFRKLISISEWNKVQLDCIEGDCWVEVMLYSVPYSFSFSMQDSKISAALV